MNQNIRELLKDRQSSNYPIIYVPEGKCEGIDPKDIVKRFGYEINRQLHHTMSNPTSAVNTNYRCL